MSYIDKNLMSSETVIYRAKLHWIIFLNPIILVLIVSVIIIIGDTGLAMGSILMGLALTAVFPAFIKYTTSEFAITNKRLVVKLGFIKRDALELLLMKVESIQVHQDIPGRILGYGTIIVKGTGGSMDPLEKISEPLKFRKKVQEQIVEVQN